MKITENRLRSIVRSVLSEQVDLSKPGDAKELYDELLSLRSNRDLDLFSKLGPDKYASLLALRDQYASDPSGYGGFFKLTTVPGQHLTKMSWDPVTNKMAHTRPEGNDYMLLPAAAHSVFNRRSGVTSASEIPSMISRRDELEAQFERSDATDTADAMYGRKRHQVIHKPTGTIVSGGVNRQGSLGT